MEERPLIKYTVNTFTINKSFQKLRFQVRHPENVYAIIGIAATVSQHQLEAKRGVDPGKSVGSLSLALPDKGDVVYNEEIRIGYHDIPDLLENPTDTIRGTNAFYIAGKRFTYFETFYLIKEAVLEGYYESYFRPLIIPEAGTTYYRLKLYIKYLTKEL